VPAQQRLRADQEGLPGRTAEEPAEGAEEQAVGRLEAGPMDLAFEDAELMAKGENLDLKCGLLAEDKEIEQRADDGVEEAQGPGHGSWRQARGGCRHCRCQAISGGRITWHDPLS